ncbi:hypothetical protein [Pasteuria penetrans]|uniref:hypothetical protein n=1 Tax=Pasteuria penetrans TaxID=86005 RepID=UPI00165B794B|nr:hypothetical protein [Pasteuria penetrans]
MIIQNDSHDFLHDHFHYLFQDLWKDRFSRFSPPTKDTIAPDRMPKFPWESVKENS